VLLVSSSLVQGQWFRGRHFDRPTVARFVACATRCFARLDLRAQSYRARSWVRFRIAACRRQATKAMSSNGGRRALDAGAMFAIGRAQTARRRATAQCRCSNYNIRNVRSRFM
jgi:hypothetical protein